MNNSGGQMTLTNEQFTEAGFIFEKENEFFKKADYYLQEDSIYIGPA